MPSLCARCSGWLDAAACWATMCCSASAIISATLTPTGDRAVHLVLQMPRSLMRYPWELLRDRHGWLVDRFAIGRQVITESGQRAAVVIEHPPGSASPARRRAFGAGHGGELAGAGTLEGFHVAECFGRLLERLPGVIDPSNYKKHVDQPVTVEEFRALLRSRKYDIVHFAGHGRYDPVNPERSCWMFTDGPFYAFELQQTLANAEVRPWLIYGSACEGAHDGGLAAELSRWRVRDGDGRAVAGCRGLCGPAVENQRHRRQEYGGGILRSAPHTAHEPWRGAGAGPPERARGRTGPGRARRAIDGNRLEPGRRSRREVRDGPAWCCTATRHRPCFSGSARPTRAIPAAEDRATS